MNGAFWRRGRAVACAVTLLLLGSSWAAARFEWRDVVQQVDIAPDGSVVVRDERTLWTDESFGEAFICVGHDPFVTLTLLDGSGALSPGPPATAFQQPCAAGTEVVVRNAVRVKERRVRFVYRLEGTVEAFTDVVQWYWNLIQLDHPPIIGYHLTVTAPGPMSAPYDAFVMRYSNPETPRVTLSPDRSQLTVEFDLIPHGDGVEVRYLMDPELFSLVGAEPALEDLQRDQERIARQSRPALPKIHVAVEADDHVAVASLLRSGEDPNSRDAEGRTPLMVAARDNRTLVNIEALLAAGADILSRDSEGLTALHYASAANDKSEVVRVLLAAGADVAAQSRFGLTPLLVAAGNNPHSQIHRLLLDHGADPNETADLGLTALMVAAAFNSNPDVITFLLDAGADATAISVEGKRAIDYARLNADLFDTPAYWRLNDASFR